MVARCVTRGVARLRLPHRGEAPGFHQTSIKTTAHGFLHGRRRAFANSSELLGGGEDGCANLFFAVQARDEEANTGRVLVNSRVENGMNLDASPEKRVRETEAVERITDQDGDNCRVARASRIETVRPRQRQEQTRARTQALAALRLTLEEPDGRERGGGIRRGDPDAEVERRRSIAKVFDELTLPGDVATA